MFEADDFGEEFTPELREREERLRAQTERAGSSAADRDAVATSGAQSSRVADRVRPADRGLARLVRDVALAEDLAQERSSRPCEQWPESGVPDNPGAWLMAAAKHRAVDGMRRAERAERKTEELGRDADRAAPREEDLAAAADDPFDDDLLRLIFTACHPVLSPMRGWR